MRGPFVERVPGTALEARGNVSLEADCTHSGPTFFTNATPVGRRLSGPWQLENGWFQVLADIGEFEAHRPHRWEMSESLSIPNGWTPLGRAFTPAETGLLPTLTNASAHAQQFFRLVVP